MKHIAYAVFHQYVLCKHEYVKSMLGMFKTISYIHLQLSGQSSLLEWSNIAA